MPARVVVLGGGVGGTLAANLLAKELGREARVTVVDPTGMHVYQPGFLYVALGQANGRWLARDERTLLRKDVDLAVERAIRIHPDAGTVQLERGGSLEWDYLVIATGYLNDFNVIPGIGPGGNAYSITSLEGAVDAAEGWARFLNDPGPVVVGATQGAACFGAAYEFVFNVTYHLRKQKLRVPVAYVSAEPFPGHFGIGGLPGGEKLLGMFFKRQKITSIWDVAMEEIVPGEMRLTDGQKLPFKYAMVVPPFIGAEVVKASGLGNPRGFIDVKDTYQTLAYPNVYAAGIAAAVNAPWQTANAVGVPKTGFPAETMAHVAAENIASQIRGEEPTKEENFADIPAVCIMDAGNNGVIILADKMLPPRKHGVMIPGPQSHAAKIAFEKYFLWKARHGYVKLP